MKWARTLKLRELIPVVDDYAARLRGWHRHRNDALARLKFPFVQVITLDRSSTDSYRPVCHLNVLVTPIDDLLPFRRNQNLRHKNGIPGRSTRIGLHVAEPEDVLAEMIRQFQPPIDQPLDETACFLRCEQSQHPSVWDMLELAALHAYYDNLPKAAESLRRYHEFAIKVPHWVDRIKDYVAELGQRIEVGDVREWLQQIGESNARQLRLIQ